jgi:hypothetical protein
LAGNDTRAFFVGEIDCLKSIISQQKEELKANEATIASLGAMLLEKEEEEKRIIRMIEAERAREKSVAKVTRIVRERVVGIDDGHAMNMAERIVDKAKGEDPVRFISEEIKRYRFLESLATDPQQGLQSEI